MDPDIDFQEQLIEEVRLRPWFYCKREKNYQEFKEKGKEWERVASILGSRKMEVQKKWKSIFEKFKREYNKEKKIKSGDGADDVYRSEWPLYDRLLFLKDAIDPKESESSLDDLFAEKEKVPTNHTNSSNDLQHFNNPMVPGKEKHNLETTVDEVICQTPLELSRKNSSIQNRDMQFFETMLPHVNKIAKEVKYEFKNDIIEMVQAYAHPKSNAAKRLRYRNKTNCTDKENVYDELCRLRAQIKQLEQNRSVVGESCCNPSFRAGHKMQYMIETPRARSVLQPIDIAGTSRSNSMNPARPTASTSGTRTPMCPPPRYPLMSGVYRHESSGTPQRSTVANLSSSTGKMKTLRRSLFYPNPSNKNGK